MMSKRSIQTSAYGVTLHSIELDDALLNSLDVLDGSFSDTDRLVIGVSAIVFDVGGAVDEFILWMRHEGRCWLDIDMADGVVLAIDDRVVPLTELLASQPFIGESGELNEKVEFSIADSDLEAMIDSSEVSIELRSDNGIVRKRLSESELNSLAVFRQLITEESQSRIAA